VFSPPLSGCNLETFLQDSQVHPSLTSVNPPLLEIYQAQATSRCLNSMTSATNGLPDHLHQPPSVPPHSNVLASVIADQLTAVLQPSPNYPSVPTITASSTNVIAGQHLVQASLGDVSVSIMILERANDVTLNNSLITEELLSGKKNYFAWI
jgi:hypothetical protein